MPVPARKRRRRTPGQIARGVRRRARRLAGRLRHVWRRSLQLRVVTSTLVLSMAVVVVLGVFLMQSIVASVLTSTEVSAVEESRANIATASGYLTPPADSTDSTQAATARGRTMNPVD